MHVQPRESARVASGSLHVLPRGLCKYPYFRQGFHHVAMIFLPDFLYNSFLFLNFANKYRRYVVKTAQAHGPDSLSAGWRCDIAEILTSVCCYSELLWNVGSFKYQTEWISRKRLCVKHGRDLSGLMGILQPQSMDENLVRAFCYMYLSLKISNTLNV